MRTPLYTVELPLFQSSETRTPLYTVEPPLFQSSEMRTTLYTVEPPLFQSSEMRTLLYTVETLYSNPLKWRHLCINKDIQITTCVLAFIEFLPLKWDHPQGTSICSKMSGKRFHCIHLIRFMQNWSLRSLAFFTFHFMSEWQRTYNVFVVYNYYKGMYQLTFPASKHWNLT